MDYPEVRTRIFEACRRHYVDIDIEAAQAVINQVIEPELDKRELEALEWAVEAPRHMIQDRVNQLRKELTKEA